MKRFLLWVVGVILGVAVLLGAVMTVSYSFTGEGSRPAADTQFGGQALEVNGSCWQVPLLGGVFDKVFTSPETLTVQKLGVLYDAHPALALPDWASYTTLTIETDIGSIVFAGSASQYEDFLFPANGDYKAKLTSGGCRRTILPPSLRAAPPVPSARTWVWSTRPSPRAGTATPSGSPCRPARRSPFPPSGWSRAVWRRFPSPA